MIIKKKQLYYVGQHCGKGHIHIHIWKKGHIHI